MRTLLVPSFLLGLLLPTGAARADDAVKAVIDKAIKAHGGSERLARKSGTQTKSKGTLDLAGGLDFTQEISIQNGKFREVMHLQVAGQDVNVTTVYDGAKAWVKTRNDETKELDGKILNEIREVGYMTRLSRFVFLKDKSVELAALGEATVNDRPAVGVRVSSKGHRDANLYFDKESGLLTKVEQRKLDVQNDKEVTEERIIKEYQDVDGMKAPKKVLVNRDGKKFMEIEVTEIKFPEKIDDSEFAKP